MRTKPAGEPPAEPVFVGNMHSQQNQNKQRVINELSLYPVQNQRIFRESVLG
jgi:hypothetical protein